jgi:HSP20 family molecular chaperone IbpA
MDLWKELDKVDSLLGSPARTLLFSSLQTFPVIDLVKQKTHWRITADVAGF